MAVQNFEISIHQVRKYVEYTEYLLRTLLVYLICRFHLSRGMINDQVEQIFEKVANLKKLNYRRT